MGIFKKKEGKKEGGIAGEREENCFASQTQKMRIC